MPRAVLLRHDLPDGSSHYDWMIQRAGGPDRPLATFRVRDRIDHSKPPEFPAERLADHRAAYLQYEGPVSGDRGQVLRVADGEMTIVEESAGRLVVEGRLGSAQGRFEGSCLASGAWTFRFIPAGV